jgi:uncharacterized membrane protein (DUF4010 family)
MASRLWQVLQSCVMTWLWMRRLDQGPTRAEQTFQPKNPLELGAASLFAGLFVGMLFITHFALLYLGRAGLFALAGVMGVTDVDPFILSLAESGSALTPVTERHRAAHRGSAQPRTSGC